MKTLKSISLVTTLVVLFSFSAIASPYDFDGRTGLGLGVGSHQAGNSDIFVNSVDEEWGAGLWLRYHLSTSWALELSYDRFQYKNSKPELQALDLSLALRMWASSPVRVILQVGAGTMMISEYRGFEDNVFAVKGRLGLEVVLSDNWAMAIHGDYHYADVNKYATKEIHMVAPMLAFTYYFGSSAPDDSDGDGVFDDVDKCPGTLAGPAVDKDGCPLKEEKAAVDSDYDGIPDGVDQCPQSEMGRPVNELGCSPKQKIEFALNVQFASGKTIVEDRYKVAMEEFASFMKKYPGTRAEIAGHTDSTGTDKFNYFISQKRADAVRKFLIEQFSIGAVRLTSKGYGPSQPIADNKTVEGKQKNRRVVATVEAEID